MKKRLPTLAAALFVAARLCAQSGVAPARLAVVAPDPSLAKVEDLLTVDLSKQPGLVLLERAEVEKVYREQGLSAANREDLKLGRILGADGLLLLDVVRTKQKTNLMARLIAVKPGVVLTDGSFAWPLQDPTQWAESVAAYLQSFLPKLAVSARDAIPLSMVNLRSAVQSAETLELEKQLKLLAIQRLSLESRLFVLERQRMQLLSEEKELKSDESAFWDGRYLLDGVVDQQGYSRDRVTISARLTPPGGAAPLQFEVSGSRTNLAQVVNRLADKVASLLRVRVTVQEWNAAREAEEFFKEAGWALRWRIYAEAQAAAESAWALGKHDPRCASVRIRSYLDDAAPAGINELYEQGSYRDQTGTPGALESFIQELTNARPGEVIWSIQRGTARYVILKHPPDPLKFVHDVQALALYDIQLHSMDSNELTAGKEWHRLGTRLLESTGQWLRDYYLARGARGDVASQLASARRLCRRVAPILAKTAQANDRQFWDVLGGFGVYWCETPEEGTALYKKLFASGHYSSVRRHVTGCYPIFCNPLLLPELAAWRETDRPRIRRVWQSLVREMCASTNGALRGNGCFFASVEARDPESFLQAFKEASQCFYGEDSRIEADLRSLYDERTGEFTRDQLRKARRKVFADSAPPPNPHAPEMPWPAGRLSRAGPQPAPGVSRPLAPASLPDAEQTNHIEVTRFWIPRLPGNVRLSAYPGDESDGPSSGKVLSFCYREGYLWVETEFEWGVRHGLPGGSEITQVNLRVFFRVDLKSFKSQAIAVDRNRYEPQDVDSFAGPFRTFEVYAGHLYISSSDGVRRYSLATRAWENLPAPVGGYARVTAIDGDIYLSGSDAILQMTPDGRTSRVLASTRRRPAKTVLDKLDHYYVKVAPDWSTCRLFPAVFPGPNGGIMTLINGGVYLLPPGAGDWTLLAEIPGGREASRSFSTNGLLVLAAPELREIARNRWYGPPRELYLIHGGSTNIERIFAGRPNPNGWDLKRYHINPQPRPAKWRWPQNMEATDAQVCLDGESIWVLGKVQPGKDPVLLHYYLNKAAPVMYSLHFHKPPNESASDWRLHWPKHWIELEPSPAGLVLTWEGKRGFWLIPAADLQAKE